jgi:hypothetical protein
VLTHRSGVAEFAVKVDRASDRPPAWICDHGSVEARYWADEDVVTCTVSGSNRD